MELDVFWWLIFRRILAEPDKEKATKGINYLVVEYRQSRLDKAHMLGCWRDRWEPNGNVTSRG